MQDKKVRSLLVWNVAMLILFSVFYKMNAVFDKTAFNHVTLRTHKMSMCSISRSTSIPLRRIVVVICV